jgi:hypothetical protein
MSGPQSGSCFREPFAALTGNLSRHARIAQEVQQRVNPEVYFQLFAADSLSEWQITIVESMSNTNPGRAHPPTIKDGRRSVRPADLRQLARPSTGRTDRSCWAAPTLASLS